MSNEPKVTRFGADPTVDQELATKAYVDASGGNSGFFGMCESIVGAGATDLFQGLNTGGFSTTTDTDSGVIGTQLTIKRFTVKVYTNSKASDVPVHIQDDASNVVTITVGAGVTGDFDSGEVTVVIAADSIVGILTDRGSVGTWDGVPAVLGIAELT